MNVSRCDTLLAALAAEIEARRGQIDGAEDLKRAEFILAFDERSGELLDVIFRTETRRRVVQRLRPENGRLSIAVGR